MPDYLAIFMTASTEKEAAKIAHCLLEERLIACANIIGPISSIFWWEERIDRATEFLVLMKSSRKLFDRLSKRIREIHTYEVPEILALPILAGSPSYLNWLQKSLQPGSDDG